MSTHAAIVTVTPQGPLESHQFPTLEPEGNEVKIVSQWTASTPLDLHQADGHLLVKAPQILGGSTAGTVISVGPDVKHLKLGDKVFGFTWRFPKEKGHQTYVITNENLLAKLPEGMGFEEAVVVPDNFVTAWHLLTKEFGFELPWPKPQGYVPPEKDSWILVFGGASSSGMYTLQILNYYGYDRVLATASKAHHDKLKRFGVRECFDYRAGDVSKDILAYMKKQGEQIKFFLDCIGSLKGTTEPISKVAESGSRVALLLPLIVRDAAPGVRPEYEMDIQHCVPWAPGVEVSGVRTHFYLENQFLAEKLQPEIMPQFMSDKIIESNDYIVVEGNTTLERAEKALGMLRNKQVSGQRLVWKVADDKDVKAALQQIKA